MHLDSSTTAPQNMDVLHTPDEARRLTMQLRQGDRSVGIVPTMGALHEGHLSLVRISQQRCDATVATLFVNPTQFGPAEDLDKYPRAIQRDRQLLSDAGVAAVFIPSVESMYGPTFSTYIDPPEVGKSLEGICRPGHFRGVTTIVSKLFNAVPATHAFFGKKDYQQWRVIEAMTRDLNFGIEIVAGETVRESDGLALSSRNQYLSEADRDRALLLSESLAVAEEMAGRGETQIDVLQSSMRQTLLGASRENPGRGVDKIDYAVVVDAETLSPLSQLDRPAVALIAAYVGQTRLIDNRELGDHR